MEHQLDAQPKQTMPLWGYALMMTIAGGAVVALDTFGSGGYTWRGLPVGGVGWALLVIGALTLVAAFFLRNRE